MTATTAPAAPEAPAGRTAAPARRGSRWRGPWRHAWFLEGFTWVYLLWSLAPIAVAVLFSFNKGRSQATYQGLSLRWYTGDKLLSVLHNPALHSAFIQTLRLSFFTTLIAVPLGVAFALGINRWVSRTSKTFNYLMLMSFVVPELIFGVAMFFMFTVIFRFVHLGTVAEVLGLVTWNVSWSAIIVQARLVTIGRQYEEAAADLGCPPLQAIRRVLLPMLTPAIFASAVLVFAGVIDDFVIVQLLSSTSGTQPMSVIIYSTQRGGNGGPALNALATIMLVLSFVVAGLGFLGYRWLSRGERIDRKAALATIAGA